MREEVPVDLIPDEYRTGSEVPLDMLPDEYIAPSKRSSGEPSFWKDVVVKTGKDVLEGVMATPETVGKAAVALTKGRALPSVLAQMGVQSASGVAALSELTHPLFNPASVLYDKKGVIPKVEKSLKWGEDINQAIMERLYPEEQQAVEEIGKVFKPIEMAGEGWQKIIELTPLEGTIAEPLAKTLGEVAAMGALGGEAFRAIKTRNAKLIRGVAAKNLEKTMAVAQEKPIGHPTKPVTAPAQVPPVIPSLKESEKIQKGAEALAEETKPVEPALGEAPELEYFRDAIKDTEAKIAELPPEPRKVITKYEHEIKDLREQVNIGEAGKRTLNAMGEPVVTQSTYPSWMQNKGWTKQEVLNAIDKGLSGEKLGIRQQEIFDTVKVEAKKQYAETVKLAQKKAIRDIPTGELEIGDRVRVHGETLKVTDKTPEKIVIKDGQEFELDPYFDKITGKKLTPSPIKSGEAPKPSAEPIKAGEMEVAKPKPTGIRTTSDIITDIKTVLGDIGKAKGLSIKDVSPKELARQTEQTKAVLEARDRLIKDAKDAGKKIEEFLSENGLSAEDIAKITPLFKKQTEPTLEKPVQEITTTGIKNSIVDMERVQRGLEPIETPMRAKDPLAWDKAKASVDSGEINPRTLAQSVADKPRNISQEEIDILRYDRMRIKNEYNKIQSNIETAIRDGNKELELRLIEQRSKLEDAYNINDMATKISGTEWAYSGHARQVEIAEDYSLANIIRRAKADRGGRELTDAERKKYEGYAKRIEEAERKIEEYEAQLSVRKTRTAVSKIKNEVEREKRQIKRTYNRQELDIEFHGLLKELNSALGGQLNVGVDPTVVLVLGKIAKNRVKAGYITAEGLVDHVYTEIKNFGIDLTEREVAEGISRYGITSKLSQKEIDVQLREVRRQLRLLLALEDAEAKQIPLRSGLQRDVPSDRVRELQRKVKEKMRENGIDSTVARSPEEQWKTALDAVKTRLRHQIDDITKQLETGEKTPKRKGIVYDEEALALKKTRDDLKKILEATEGKRELSDEQRVKMATAAVERSIKEYERRIQEKDLTPQKKISKTPETPELKKLREIRENLKQEFKKMQHDARPVKTPEEIARQAFKTRTLNKIAELENKLAIGDFTKEPKKTRELTPEELKLRHQLELVKHEYNVARFNDELARRTTLQKIGGGTTEAINLSRAIKTSFDLSAVLRQGTFIVFGHPIRGAKSIPDMFRALRSKEGQFAVDYEILHRPNYPLYEKSGLYLAEHGQKLSRMEEVYMSRWAEKIPGVAASQRAYTTFLNKLRADSFDSMAQNLSKKGTPTEAELKAISNYINTATGRGSLGMKENALVGLNTVFFAPRYVASRFQLLAGQPLYRGSAATRIMIAKEYARFLVGLGTVYSLGLMAGGDIEFDPRSSDFGKIRFGKTRLDPLAGISQSTVLVSRLITGETKTIKGKILPIRGEKVPYGASSTEDILARFLRSKLSPVVGTGVDIFAGENYIGEPVTITSVPQGLLEPLATKDILEAMIEQGIPEGAALGILAIFGMGLQTYTENEFKRRRRNSRKIY